MGIPAVESASGANPGAPTLMRNGHPDPYVGIGNYPVRIIDQAVGYATLANGGLARPAYFVQKVTDADGNVVFEHKDKAKRVLDKRVANDTTLAMEDVARTSGIAPSDGRPVAAKTGTVGIQDTGDSSDGWTVGFTPQVSAASWVGSDKVRADLRRQRQVRVRPGPGRQCLEALHGRLPRRQAGAAAADHPADRAAAAVPAPSSSSANPDADRCRARRPPPARRPAPRRRRSPRAAGTSAPPSTPRAPCGLPICPSSSPASPSAAPAEPPRPAVGGLAQQYEGGAGAAAASPGGR